MLRNKLPRRKFAARSKRPTVEFTIDLPAKYSGVNPAGLFSELETPALKDIDVRFYVQNMFELGLDFKASCTFTCLHNVEPVIRAELWKMKALLEDRLNAIVARTEDEVQALALGHQLEGGATEAPNEAEDLVLRASRVVSKVPQVWSRFGSFLPPRSRKLLNYDLAEHAADFFEAMATATTRRQQNWLIGRFTAVAVAKGLARAGVALRCRLLDELASLMGVAGGRGVESPRSTPRD